MHVNCQPVELKKCYLLLNHGPVCLVSSAFQGRRNVMAASWVMPLDFDPPKVLLVIDSSCYTRELVESSGEFALNLPFRCMADKVLAVGSVSGRDSDKFSRHEIEVFPAHRIEVPLVSDCAAWLECKVTTEKHNQKHYDLFIAEVVAAWADPSVFSNERWHFSDATRKTIHYQAGGSFFETGEVFECKNTLE